jgi:uncharacterized membrane protein YebE (DUF533 family)
MALDDRLPQLCDLLLGAAHADKRFVDREREEVRELLVELSGAPLTKELEKRIGSFKPKGFDLAATAAAFHDDSEDDRRRVLLLVSAITDADDEVDFAEDDYLRALAKALALPDSALAGLTVEVESHDLKDDLAKVRRPPPPPPPRK